MTNKTTTPTNISSRRDMLAIRRQICKQPVVKNETSQGGKQLRMVQASLLMIALVAFAAVAMVMIPNMGPTPVATEPVTVETVVVDLTNLTKEETGYGDVSDQQAGCAILEDLMGVGPGGEVDGVPIEHVYEEECG